MTRLSRASLPSLPAGVAGPRVDPWGLGTGIVHLGIGAFHRAHQAVFTEDAMAATGDTRWGICGVTQRSSAVRDLLVPQDGLYTVLERGSGTPSARVVGAVRSVLSGTEQEAQVSARIADPQVHVVTLTVTEKGYRPAAGTGGTGPAVRRLLAGLRQRWSAHGAPLTVLSCDNLSGNGELLRALVLGACVDDELARWIDASVAFPSSVVDRIVPATTDEDLADVERLLGLRDLGAVVTEPYLQWVIEDAFAGPRPAWESAGALLTDDVAPYEAAKLRLLNASHSLLAYAGALAGYDTIAQAVADPVLAEAAHRLMSEDAGPTLTLPAGFDLAAYQQSVLDRFANPALRHRTVQVAADGSQKLPVRLLGTIRDRLAVGAEPVWAAYAVGAWMGYVARSTAADGRALPLDDPCAAELRDAVAGRTDAQAVVAALLGVRAVFGEDLAADEVFRALLVEGVRRFLAPS